MDLGKWCAGPSLLLGDALIAAKTLGFLSAEGAARRFDQVVRGAFPESTELIEDRLRLS